MEATEGGARATFSCAATGDVNIMWKINGQIINTEGQVELLGLAGINVPLSTPSEATVTISPFESLDGTTVQCVVVNPEDSDDIIAESETAELSVTSKFIITH